MKEIFWVAWKRFTIISSIVADAQGRAIAVLFYFTILVPFGIGSRLFSDPLRIKSRSGWIDREPVGNKLEEAMRQG